MAWKQPSEGEGKAKFNVRQLPDPVRHAAAQTSCAATRTKLRGRNEGSRFEEDKITPLSTGASLRWLEVTKAQDGK